MLKPKLLREHLTRLVPTLANDPDKLLVFIEDGKLRTNWGKSLSFEYQYTLKMIVLDFADHADTVFVPILLWLKTHQPELILNADRQASGIGFVVEPLSHETSDIEIKLMLTERVKVAESNGGLEVMHLGENIPSGNLWAHTLPGLGLGETVAPAWPS
ncbi:phage tail protein [Chitinimonas sp. BJB300]|uniref:phage tail protein n=1 Tax=Chitinimonas sp. BJB300 TaxID=1559339 RepID=UPI000C0FF24B|nr:phage tail protein [Chitinimonas sp. BJB300]PHV11319.1 phage tail protein [Chitinimonas sp. BJB300]TSJ88214.1 phage tail protein [Chitinimonas sp. BJB300]